MTTKKFLENKNVLTFDLETTGNDFEKSEIIQVSMILERDGEILKTYNTYVDPENDELEFDAGMMINEIEWGTIKNAPPFIVIAQEVLEMLNKADIIIGYKVSFDFKFIQKALLNNGFKPNQFTFLRAQVIDPYMYWIKMQRRTLKDCINEFLNVEIEGNLHDSLTDVKYTRMLVEPMIERFGTDIQDFIKTTNEKPIGSSGLLTLDHYNNIKFTYGKHQGKTLDEVKTQDLGYLSWIVASNFDAITKSIVQNKLTKA